MSNYLGHCWCYTGWDAPSSKGPLAAVAVVVVAAVAVVVLGFAECRATDGVEVPGGLKDGVKGSESVQDFEQEPTGEESLGAAGAGVGVDGGGCGELLQA
jgi:hypothetical protein